MPIKNIILSRKGFDSGSGGKASVIYQNQLISLPIPQEGTKTHYSDLKAFQGISYRDLMNGLNIKPYEECHLDPDLVKNVKRRPKDWKPVFGQFGGALSHLNFHDVGVGDLFLFFGWFKEVEKKNGKFFWVKNTAEQHIIYGYLEVGKVIDLTKENFPRWVKNHPHCVMQDKFNPKGNMLYVAADKLSLNSSLPGAGVFPFDEKLILTSPFNNNHKRSVWALPEAFFDKKDNCKLSYHYQRKGIRSGDCPKGLMEVQSVARGQEFVMEVNADVRSWMENLFKKILS